jgi:hypothetical protein
VTNFYRAYGLTLASDASIPGLHPQFVDTHRVDLQVATGLEPEWVKRAMRLSCRPVRPRPGTSEAHESVRVTWFGADDFCELDYGDGTRFVLDQREKRLWGSYQPPLTFEDLATYLAGPVLGFILRSRGVTALHASALSINEKAIMLCGESESGKSTTVAALAVRKFPVLAEDISAIRDVGDKLFIESGYPRICLWPDAVEKLFGEPEALPLLTPTWDKRFLPLDGVRASFKSERQPLGAIYMLSPRAEDARAPFIEDLSARDALLLLVQNTYMNWLLNRGQRAAELDVLTKVVERVPVRRVFPHTDSIRIDSLCDLIAGDARRLFGAR